MRLSLLFALSIGLSAAPRLDPAGFRVDLPDGWQTANSAAGHIVIASPNPLEYVFVQPQLNRTADCSALLRQTLSGAGSNFSSVEQLEIQQSGRGLATARFLFQQRQARGAILCAETSSRSAMFYGLSAPAAEFERRRPALVNILRSFSFTGKSSTGAPTPLPQLVDWREPNELAYSLAVPSGWRVQGGIQRQDVTHYTDGVDMRSADNGSDIRIGDPRFASCLIPGQGSSGFQSPNMCAYQSGAQFGDRYVRQHLARDFGITPTKVEVTERPDIARAAEAPPASLGLRVKVSAAEVRWEGNLRGVPVAGAVLAQTTFFQSSQGQNFLLGQLSFDIRSFFGPPAEFARLARLTGSIVSSKRVNPTWWSQTQQINEQIAQKTREQMHAQAAQQQQTFWDRMASADRRAASVGDVLSGTVRLSDSAGNQYQAQAGSNYYFLDTNAARTAGRPDDAVRRTDQWPNPLVDLTQLETIY